MEVLDRAPAVSPDGRAVVFMLSVRGREVKAQLRVTHSKSISGYA